ncbi:MAG TPA: hypothetical protein VMT78_10435, partial [Terriglobia bacterium]|nr:hypothetical protein [Terriglobia bacterium]
SFFDSHPATPDRVVKTREHAKEITQVRRAPISPSRDAFLSRLNGLVVGQRTANGIIRGNTFIHPDSNFFIEFPQKSHVANSPRQIVAVTADGDAAIAVNVVAEGNDPLDGARAAERSTKSPVVNQTRAITINGLPAAETHLNANAKTGIDLIWIAYRGQIYQVAGVAPVERSNAFRELFLATARSFRPLSADDLAGLTETRIRLVRAHADETLDALAARSHSAWKKEEIAVANGLSVDQRLKKDLLVKVSIAEPYEHKRVR